MCNRDQLLRWFNSNTGLWYNNQNSPYWWQEANMVTVLAKYGKLNTGVASQIAPIISTVYDKAAKNKPFALLASQPSSNLANKLYIPQKDTDTNPPANTTTLQKRAESGFTNKFYDDSGWWGLAFVAAWEMTGNIKYLNEAIYIWNDMHAAWGTTPCGGLWWNKDANSPVVAISNGGLLIKLALAISILYFLTSW